MLNASNTRTQTFRVQEQTIKDVYVVFTTRKFGQAASFYVAAIESFSHL